MLEPAPAAGRRVLAPGSIPRRTPALLIFLLTAACASGASPAPTTAAPTSPAEHRSSAPSAPIKKIVVIVMENSTYATISEGSDTPFIQHTIAPHTISLTNMHANSSPSLPNYAWMAAGQSCGSDGSDSAWGLTCPSVFDQLDRRGIPWSVYAEGYPGGPDSCFTGASSGDYARKHAPPLLFSSTSTGTPCTSHMRSFPNEAAGPAPADNFSGARLTDLTYVIPNLCHDMHDPSYLCGQAGGGQAGGDAWLAKNWGPLLADAGPRGVVILTWDESSTSDEHIATYIGGAAVRTASTEGRAYDHASTLRAIEDALGLPCLANACTATPVPLAG